MEISKKSPISQKSHGFPWSQATSGSRGDVKIRHRRRAGRTRRVSSRPGNLGEVRVKGEFSWRKCGKNIENWGKVGENAAKVMENMEKATENMENDRKMIGR